MRADTLQRTLHSLKKGCISTEADSQGAPFASVQIYFTLLSHRPWNSLPKSPRPFRMKLREAGNVQNEAS